MLHMPIFIALDSDQIPGVDGVMLKWMTDITVYFNSPEFDALRQTLSMKIDIDTQGSRGWTWSFLTCHGRHYLAHFLVPISKTPLCTSTKDDSNPN